MTQPDPGAKASEPPEPVQREIVLETGVPHWVRRVGLASWYLVGFGAAVGLVVLTFGATSDITIPLLVGGFLAIAFSGLVTSLERRGVNRSLGAALVLVLIVGLLVGSVVLVGVSLGNQGDELAARMNQATADLRGWANDLQIDAELVDRIREGAGDSGAAGVSGVAGEVAGVLDSAVGVVTGSILGLVVLYYLLKDGPALIDRFIERAPESRRETYRRIADDSGNSVDAYVRGRTVMAFMNALVMGVGSAVMGVPLPFSIAVVNFIGAYIPYLGAFIGGAFAFLLALSVGGFPLALAIIALSLVTNLLLENMLEPRVMGDAMELHPLVVLVVTVLGGAAAGMVGLILATPLTAIGLNLYRELKASGFFD